MIDLYTWTTPNGRKASIMLEECGLEYQTFPINITTNKDQFEPSFLKISPNNRIPAIVDHDTDVTMMESGAILIYLAEKTGRFLPQEPVAKYKTIELKIIYTVKLSNHSLIFCDIIPKKLCRKQFDQLAQPSKASY